MPIKYNCILKKQEHNMSGVYSLNNLIHATFKVCFLKLVVINNALFGFGRLAQLVEHLVYTKLVQQNKNSNNLLSITIIAYLIEQL